MTETLRKPMTAAELATLPDELPSGPVRYELWEGELRVRALPGEDHGSVEGTIGGYLFMHGELRGQGQVRTGDVGIVLGHDPDTVVGADAAFLTNDQLSPQRSREGWLETIPALIVEVRSKNDTAKRVADKVAAYLAAGARVVWVADPRRRAFFVHRPDQKPVELRPGDTLTADDIIPGFAVPVADLFAGLE